MVEKAGKFIHMGENPSDSTIRKSNYPEYQNYNFDSISAFGAATTDYYRQSLNLATNWGSGTANRVLVQHKLYNDSAVYDSITVDGYHTVFNTNGTGVAAIPTVAGVPEAAFTYALVRKNRVKQGTLNWALSAGSTAEDSEWLLIPKLSTRNIPTTIGTHGAFSPSAESETLGFDLNAKTLTVPWGIYRTNNGDSLFNYMSLGPGMAWQFLVNSNPDDFENGKYVTVTGGDTLRLLTIAGDVVDTTNLRVIQQAPAASETRVFPTRNFIPRNPLVPTSVDTWSGGTRYYVTGYNSIMDTVGNIPYSTRVDTLYKYLDKAELAKWEIVLVDGRPRVDLLHGDILRVTAENGTDTKDYYLDVLPYAPSSNANLASITWPDIPGVILEWTQDTIPGFSPQVRTYQIKLPFMISGVPALKVTTQNQNATVEMFPANTIEAGPAALRTTRIQVTAEDDSTVVNYNIVFTKQKLAAQDWEAEPIISEISSRTIGAGYVEFYNPGTIPIDLSNYYFLYSMGSGTMEASLTRAMNRTDKINMYQAGYIPGMKWPATFDDYQLNPGVMVFDPVVDPILEPGDAFLIFTTRNLLPTHFIHTEKRAKITFFWSGMNATARAAWTALGGNEWGEMDASNFHNMNASIFSADNAFWLLKVLNDSIQNRTKPIRDVDDFEIIDVWGRAPEAEYIVAGRPVKNSDSDRAVMKLKPNYLLPTTIERDGWGTNAEDSKWKYIKLNDNFEGRIWRENDMVEDAGYHTADEATFYLSIVSSLVYKVDEGYEGSLSIRGVSKGESVDAFFTNLIKADPGQTLVVSATAGGDAKAPADAVAANDLLTVTSADGTNQTVYTISIAPLDANNTLTLAAGSNLTLSREGNAGSISGFPFGATISSVFEQVEKPALASIAIVDAKDQLVPFKVLNRDTVYVPTLAGNQVYFKVRAENGDVALYNLQPSSSASDAYVLSNVYVVDQEESTISVVAMGISVAGFYANLMPVPGATMQVRKKSGEERNLGTMNMDDFLYVTSEDKSVMKVYFVEFINEPAGLQPEFRTLAPDPTNLSANVPAGAASITLAWDYEFGLEFGFVISRDGAAIDTVFTNAFTDQDVVTGTTYEYSVHAYNEFGNSGAVTRSVIAYPTAVDQKVAEGISIFPNVTTDMVYFRNVPENSRVVLVDLTGRSILVKKASELTGGLSLQPYANGYYMIRVMQGQEYVKSVKVLKK